MRAAVVLLLSALAVQGATKPAVPVDAIPAIVEAFKTHHIVALSDAHGNEQSQAFLKALVNYPAFADTVNDIVVEFGNARYQNLVDRYVGGEDVRIDALRVVWQNTTIANEIPVDAGFFQAVREINVKRPRERHVRVLLGDPPIDWSTVKSFDDHFKWLAMRDSYPAALIQVEVLARERRALLVYGQFHFMRKNTFSNLDMTSLASQTIVSILELTNPEKVFAIWSIGDALAKVQPGDAKWRYPDLALVQGTTIGAADVTTFFPTPARFAFRGTERLQIPKDQWLPLRVEDQFDAVLYLGPDANRTEQPLSPSLCADKAYVEERLRRIALTRIPPFEAERVRKLCGI
jgi:hypothetical protein